jgi:general secretion pathway protein D
MTSKLFTGGVAVAVALAAIPAAANPTSLAAPAAIAVHAVGQASKAKEYERRKEAERLLKTAREALAEGNLETAESYVSRAEALGLTYSKVFLFGDTPQKARRDLEKRKSAAGKRSSADDAGGKEPSERPRSQRAGSAASKNVDPFGSADTSPEEDESPAPIRRQPKPLALDEDEEANFAISKRSETPVPVRSRPGLEMGEGIETGDSSSDAHLIAARRFLAVGDVVQARQRIEQARELGIEYDAGADNPDQIETALRDFEHLQSRSAAEGNSDAIRRAHATLLVDQAQALLRWKQYDEAERLAEDAARLSGRSPEMQARPKQLLTRIAHERRANGQNPGIAGNQGGASAKARAVRLAAEARQAMARGEIERAEGLVRQAEALRVPEAQFAPGEDRPSTIARAIRTRRSLESSPAGMTSDELVMPAAGARSPDKNVQRLLFDPANDRTKNAAAQAEGFSPGDGDPLSDDPFGDDGSSEQPPLFGPPNEPAQPLPTEPKPGRALAPADALTNPAEPPPVDLPASDPPIETAPPVQLPTAEPQTESLGLQLFREGEKALAARNLEAALKNFRQANEHRADLDASTLERLDGHLQILSPPSNPTAPPAPAAGDLIGDAAKRQQLLFKQVSSDLARKQTEARNMRENEPKKALDLLIQARAEVTASGLEPQYRDQLLRRLEISVNDTEQFITANRADIELAEQNQAVLNDVERRQQIRVEVDSRLAKLVNEYNELMDEHRYPEAEALAKRAKELDPDNPVVKQLLLQSNFVRKLRRNEGILDRKEEGVASALMDVDQASEMSVGDATPLVFDKSWDTLTKSPYRRRQEQRRRRTEKEIQIERKLSSEVSINFRDKPLSEVIDHLAKVTGVPIVVDQLALQEEGVEGDALITMPLDTPISLKSALNLILEPLKLSYIIKDDVLKITSEQKRDGDAYPVTYNVADLVIPIPNFAPTGRLGLGAALQAGMADAAVTWNGSAYGNLASAGNNAMFAQNQGNDQSLGAANALAQPGSSDKMPYSQQPMSSGPGGLSGGSQADFDTLIDLIVTTIVPDSWDEVGGPGSISPFPTNLSLVISQTQDVHEQIVDLLEQLRRLQDLQVTIEVRFITLDDNFFERIGVDFDFDIGTNVTQAILGQNQNPNFQPSQSATVGLTGGLENGPPAFTSDLDLQFRQGSFGSSVPQFGGFDAATAATFGFAILSDIETFFFVQAAQGDTRTNVLQAPKVTLFNGQQASVNDTAQQPFVMSVIPVVGDFAAAQQPVIVVLPEGTHLTVQAVVSPDRRFVRMTLVPFFSNIGDVQEFTFTGSETSSDSESTTKNNTDNTTTGSKSGSTNRNGTTVQLPTFASISVATTVSVPDGGTILLGGIKRLREGRTERGVPVMSKIPYVNRLFKNVGIGRETQSLMMMVTPRIIIQEEEEAKLGVTPPPTPPTP